MRVLAAHNAGTPKDSVTAAVLAFLTEQGISFDQDYLRAALVELAQQLMEIEVSACIAAERYERRRSRRAYRNGYRETGWMTPLGRQRLRIPKLRRGTYTPLFLEQSNAGQMLLDYLLAVYLEGVTLERTERLLNALGLHGVHRSAAADICQCIHDLVQSCQRQRLQGYGGVLRFYQIPAVRDENGRVIRREVTLLVGVDEAGNRVLLAHAIGSFDHDYWQGFLRRVVGSDADVVRYVATDAYAGLRESVRTVVGVIHIQPDGAAPGDSPRGELRDHICMAA